MGDIPKPLSATVKELVLQILFILFTLKAYL